MRVKLPKTLAEPGTIPWPTTMNVFLEVQAIMEAIHNFFRSAERANTVPTDDWDSWGRTQYSIAELLDVLAQIALDAGAIEAKVIENGHEYGTKFQGRELGAAKGTMFRAYAVAGFSFWITFKVKNSKETYVTTIDFWFDPKRSTVCR